MAEKVGLHLALLNLFGFDAAPDNQGNLALVADEYTDQPPDDWSPEIPMDGPTRILLRHQVLGKVDDPAAARVVDALCEEYGSAEKVRLLLAATPEPEPFPEV